MKKSIWVFLKNSVVKYFVNVKKVYGNIIRLYSNLNAIKLFLGFHRCN